MNRLVPCFAALGAALLMAVPAQAAGAGAVSTTQTVHNGTDVVYDFQPCSATPIPGQVTISNENGVFHITTLANGTFWATGTMTGDFFFQKITNQLVVVDNMGDLGPATLPVVFDTSKPTFTGRFTTWFGDNNNLHNGSETSTFTVHGVGSDGSTITFHDTDHMSVSATGVTISFDKSVC